MGTPLVWFLWAVSLFVRSWSVDLSSLLVSCFQSHPTNYKAPLSKTEEQIRALGSTELEGQGEVTSIHLFCCLPSRGIWREIWDWTLLLLTTPIEKSFAHTSAQEVVNRRVFRTGSQIIKSPEQMANLSRALPSISFSVKNSALKYHCPCLLLHKILTCMYTLIHSSAASSWEAWLPFFLLMK